MFCKVDELVLSLSQNLSGLYWRSSSNGLRCGVRQELDVWEAEDCLLEQLERFFICECDQFTSLYCLVFSSKLLCFFIFPQEIHEESKFVILNFSFRSIWPYFVPSLKKVHSLEGLFPNQRLRYLWPLSFLQIQEYFILQPNYYVKFIQVEDYSAYFHKNFQDPVFIFSRLEFYTYSLSV